MDAYDCSAFEAFSFSYFTRTDCSTFVKLTDVVSVRQFKYLKFCIFFVHNICVTGLCLLKQSHDVKVGTSVAYMCHKFSLQLEKNSFYRGVAIWNSLPPNLCSIDCLSNFKISFKKLFLLVLFLFLLFVISFCCCIPYFVFTVVMCFVWWYTCCFCFVFLCIFVAIGHC